MSALNLVHPVCCVLGHIDVGKTKLLDKLRESEVQKKEAGGITQQIGSTYFSKDAIINLSGNLNTMIDIPGLLMIDTPGHDCFSQMRLIGVRICHLAIVVVDIIKGLEKQTIQCIEILKNHKTPFIIVLNKLDKVYGWKPVNTGSLKRSFDQQEKSVLKSMCAYSNKIICQLVKVEIDAALYYENKNVNEFVSMVPVSAKTGEGISDLIVLISKLTAKRLKNNLDDPMSLYKYSHGFMMDVRRDERLGTIYHLILMSGEIKRGDKVIIEGLDNPIETHIKELFIPGDESELKGKTHLVPVNNIIGTKGIACKLEDDIEDIINLGGLVVVHNNESDEIKSLIKQNTDILEKIDYNFDKQGVIVNVPAKSMANAILKLMTSENKNKLKIKDINVGKLTKTCIIKASSHEKTSDEVETIYNRKYSVVLDYNANEPDKNIDREIKEIADASNVEIISDAIIYKLFEKYNAYCSTIDDQIRSAYPNIIKPIKLKIIPRYIFLRKNPLMFGVKIETGKLKKDITIIASKGDNKLILGKISGIQKNNKSVEETETGDEVCIRIETNSEQIEYGRHFNDTWNLNNYYTDEERYLARKYRDIFLLDS